MAAPAWAKRAASGILVSSAARAARAVNDLVMAAVEVLTKNGSMPVMFTKPGPSDLDRCKERYRALCLGPS